MNHMHLPFSGHPVSDAQWDAGLIERMPRVGDLYVAGYDGEEFGLVLVVAVRRDHVAVWPVTDNTFTPSDTCFVLNSPLLTESLVCWPEAEAGVSFATLDRFLGSVVEDTTTVAIYHYVRDGDHPYGVEFFPEAEDDEAFLDALDRVCAYATDLSDHDWPEPDSTVGVLAPAFREAYGITGPVMRDLVPGKQPRVLQDYVEGRRILPPEVVEALTARYETSPREVVAAPMGAEVVELRRPTRKHRIAAIARDRGMTEADVRYDAWARTQVAARQAGARSIAAVGARVDQALAELESGR